MVCCSPRWDVCFSLDRHSEAFLKRSVGKFKWKVLGVIICDHYHYLHTKDKQDLTNLQWLEIIWALSLSLCGGWARSSWTSRNLIKPLPEDPTLLHSHLKKWITQELTDQFKTKPRVLDFYWGQRQIHKQWKRQVTPVNVSLGNRKESSESNKTPFTVFLNGDAVKRRAANTGIII